MEENKFPGRGTKSTLKMKLVCFGYNKNKENFQISLEWKKN
jgi:hypothetical protein